jgi:exonuclease III
MPPLNNTQEPEGPRTCSAPQNEANQGCAQPGSPSESAHQRSPPPGAPNHQLCRETNQKLRANINIATLNMNGFTAPATNLSGIQKWSMINQTLNTHKIAVLALQETHLNKHTADQILSGFSKKMDIYFSADPDNPRMTARVAFVINKSCIAPETIRVKELLPGWALYLEINWLDNESTTLLNIYAPTNKALHPEFWAALHRTKQTQCLRDPSFFLRDFNVMEDPIDCAPMRLDDQAAIEALRELRHAWNLEDTWRHTNPSERAFTYRANSNGQHIQSHLDRIYTNLAISELTYDWRIAPSAVPTDHWMVKVKYAPHEAPFIGRGRWTWPLDALKDDHLINTIIDCGIRLQEDLDKLQREQPI